MRRTERPCPLAAENELLVAHNERAAHQRVHWKPLHLHSVEGGDLGARVQHVLIDRTLCAEIDDCQIRV